VLISVLAYAGDVYLLMDVAHQNGKCLFFTPSAADSILACVFHSADDVRIACSLFTLWNEVFNVLLNIHMVRYFTG